MAKKFFWEAVVIKNFLSAVILALGVFISGNVFASVEKHTDNGTNYEMSYPIVYTNNKAVQDKINQDIYHYIAAFRNDFNAGKFYQGRFSYKLRLENNDYVSLTITDSRYNMGAAHEYYVVYGLVSTKTPAGNFRCHIS